METAMGYLMIIGFGLVGLYTFFLEGKGKQSHKRQNLRGEI